MTNIEDSQMKSYETVAATDTVPSNRLVAAEQVAGLMARSSEIEPYPIRDVDSEGRVFELTVDPIKLDKAAKFEQAIWFEENYGSLEGYSEHIAHSRTITAFDGDDCVGLVRFFKSSPKLPPFIAEMPYYDMAKKEAITDACTNGLIEELGTIAVAKELRQRLVFENLARLAYRDAYYGRDMKQWGIIMEPPRVRRMNKHYGFTFEQVGPTIDYQGGMCAAHIMDLKEVNENMSQKFPDIYNWFVNEPLNV